MDDLREKLVIDIFEADINAPMPSQRVIDYLLAAGWTKPPVAQQVEPAAHDVLNELAVIEAWLDAKDAPQFGDLNAEPTPISTLGRIQALIEQSTQKPPSEPAPGSELHVNEALEVLLAPDADSSPTDYDDELTPEQIDALKALAPQDETLMGDVVSAPLNMLVDADWLCRKAAEEGDLCVEAGPDIMASDPAPAVQEQELLAGGWLPIVLCPTDGEWRLCKLPDGSEVVASFQGQDLGPMVRQWRVREFGYHNPARPTGEIFGGVERIAPAYDTAVIKNLPEGVYPIYFRPNDTVHGHPALRAQGGE